MNMLMRTRAMFAALAAGFLLFGCGGGGEPKTTDNAPVASSCADAAGCNTLLVAMTDADGDFLSYTVDVVSLKMKRANGTEVETIPNKTRVDFAQYVDVTEFVTAASVPNGSYVEGTLRLDFSNADVTVEKNGQPVAAKVVDANGAALGIVDVRVVLDNKHRLIVAPGMPSLLTLDFNLAATNTVDLTTTPVTVKARPTLIASLEPVDEKDTRVRGPLASVDVNANSYVIDVRPFNHLRSKWGHVIVHTTSTTSFEVNGQSGTGTAGLQALSSAGADTPTLAFGTLSLNDHTFTAERVYAGTSVPGHGMDAVIGTVIARSGNELTVRGGTIIRNDDPNAAGANADDRATFDRGDIKVTIGASTKIFKDGQGTQTFGPEAVSVGQLINVFGNATQTNNITSIDATNGRVRMHLSHVFGTVVNSTSGLLTMNVGSINGRRISAFNFAGTGTTTAQDADPTHYEIKTPTNTITQLTIGKPMQVLGFAMPFGAAPPDFDSKTLVGYSQLSAELGMGWGDGGTSMPFSSINASGLVFDMSNASIGLRHYLRFGPIFIDLANLTTAPTVVGPNSGAMYVVVTSSGINHYSDFADFVAAITAALNNSGKMVGFTANGPFDSTTNTLTAKVAVATLK